MPEPETPNYNKFLAMKAYTYTIRGSRQNFATNPNSYSFHEKVVKLLEPIKLEREAVFLYIDSLNLLGVSCKERMQLQKSLEFLTKAEKTFNEFVSKVGDANQAMTPYKVFDAIIEMGTKWDLNMIHNFTMNTLYNTYFQLKDQKMQLKYVIPSIRAIFALQRLQQRTQNIVFDEFLVQLSSHIEILFKFHHFAQINHLVAIFMHHLVKQLRVSPKNKQFNVKVIQSIVSHWYATWALEIVKYSCNVLRNPDFAKNNPINSDYERFEDFVEDGVEIYENQFPCDVIESYKEMKKVITKGKAWCQREFDLFGNFPVPDMPKELMKKLNDMEKEIEEFAYLK